MNPAATEAHGVPPAPGGGGRRLSRRGLLKLGAALAAAGALGCWRLSGYDAEAARLGPMRHLTPRTAVVLAAVVEAMLPPDADRSPERVRELVRRIDAYLGNCAPEDLSQLRLLLHAVEHATLIFGLKLARFTSLDAAGRADVLDGWRTSRIAECRLGLRSLVSLVFLAHYRDARAFAAIGYSGPITPGWDGPPESRARYDALLAPPGGEPAFP